MEPTMNPTPSSSSSSDGDNDDGVCHGELTKLPPDSPHGSEKDGGVDFTHEQGSESNETIDTENGSRSVDKNQSFETVAVVRAKDSETEPDSLDDDVEIVIKNQHKYYFYCPCCGEDITKTVKLVKKSDVQPTKNNDTENEAIDTENGSRSKDEKRKVPSWFPFDLQKLFHSVYGRNKDKEKKEVDSKSPGTYIDPAIDGEEPSIDVSNEKDRTSYPKWHLDVFAWLFLCIIIAISVLYTYPHQSPPVLSTSLPSFIPQHLQLPSVSSFWLPSTSILLLLPAFAVLLLLSMAMKSRYNPRYHKEKGEKMVESKSSDKASEEQSKKTQSHNDQAADPDQDSDKKTEHQKIHPLPLDPSPEEQPSNQILNKETEENVEIAIPAKTEAEAGLTPNTEPEIPNTVQPKKGGNKVEILKSIVYGGLTESITSLCTVTSAAASGASTLNVLALGVANLSSGLLLIVHSLQELINEKPREQTNSDDHKHSEEDRYEEVLGKRVYSKIHKLIAVSSFVVFGLIPPLVYGFSFRGRVEKRQEYKTLAVYGVSLICVVLLSIAKAYVSKRPEYLKTLFRYTTMATTASGFSQFVGYFVNQWLEKSGFYDDSSEIPRV